MNQYLALSIFLLFLISFAFAETAEEALQNYYKYFKEENLENYYKYVYTSDLSREQLNERKEITQELWKKFDILDYSLNIKNIEEQRDKAVVSYSLEFTVSDGEKSFSHSNNYFAYLVNEDGWKVKYIFEGEELVELFKHSLSLQSEEIESINRNNLEPFVPLAEPESPDYTDRSCTTDEECKEKGYYACVEGECIGYEEDVCLLSIMPFALSMILLLKKA